MTFTPSSSLFYVAMYYHLLYCFLLICSFILSSNLLPLPLFTPHLASGVSWLFMWYFYHGIVLGSDFPLLMLVLDYPFINQILYFLSFSYLPICSCDCSHVRISSVMERISPKLHWLPHSSPSQPLASILLADTMLLRLSPPTPLPFI